MWCRSCCEKMYLNKAEVMMKKRLYQYKYTFPIVHPLSTREVKEPADSVSLISFGSVDVPLFDWSDREIYLVDKLFPRRWTVSDVDDDNLSVVSDTSMESLVDDDEFVDAVLKMYEGGKLECFHYERDLLQDSLDMLHDSLDTIYLDDEPTQVKKKLRFRKPMSDIYVFEENNAAEVIAPKCDIVVEPVKRVNLFRRCLKWVQKKIRI